MLALAPGSDALDRLPLFSLRRWLSGMHRAELVADLDEGGPYTLIAPVDEAFDGLPCTFEQLLRDPRAVESCVDLFEYLVVRGTCEAEGPARPFVTLHGESIEVGDGRVVGVRGTGRILLSVVWRGVTLHLVDACVWPSELFALRALTRAPAGRARGTRSPLPPSRARR